jgi:hypothetical protein
MDEEYIIKLKDDELISKDQWSGKTESSVNKNGPFQI